MKKFIEICPLTDSFNQTITLPGSKSITNRVLLLASLALGESTLQNFYLSDDIDAMLEALRSLGIRIELDQENHIATVWGNGGKFSLSKASIFTRDSGTVTRFLIPVLAAQKVGEFTISASERMSSRPIKALLKAIQSLGADIQYLEKPDSLPLILNSKGLSGGELAVATSESSQFLSGLLMASGLAQSSLTFISSHNQSYVKMTVKILERFGREINQKASEVEEGNEGWSFKTQPGLLNPVRDFMIEPDLSTASYFFGAAALTGSQIEIKNISWDSLQGDIEFLRVLESMGAEIFKTPNSLCLKGPKKLKGISVNMRHFSDTFMTLAALASFADSPVEIHGITHTRFQESDRIQAMADNLQLLGGEVEVLEDGLRIFPKILHGGIVSSHGDHRIAMAMSLIGLKIPGIQIEGYQCVKKTCPDYFERLKRL